MKKHLIIICLALSVLCSCSTLPQKMDSFVDNAELKASSYSEDDWKKSTEAFKKMEEKFKASDKEGYSDAEKKMASRAIVRYHTLLFKNGLSKSAKWLEDLGKSAPDYLEGLSENIENGADNFLNQLESLVDTAAFNSTIKELGATLENLFGSLSGEGE